MVGRKNSRFFLYVLVGVAVSASLLAFLYASRSSVAAAQSYFHGVPGPSAQSNLPESKVDESPADGLHDDDSLFNALPVNDQEDGENASEGSQPTDAPSAESQPADTQNEGLQAGDAEHGDTQAEDPQGDEMLGDGAEADESQADESSQDEPAKDIPSYNPDKWHFQAELNDLVLPDLNGSEFRNFPPHNYRGPGHETFALFYATRDGSFRDPYFLATMNIIYRLLWSPEMKSKHPVTVFVTSFISEEFRAWFATAGAIVRQLELLPFEPTDPGVPARLQDVFSKLEMWKQTDFTRIAYMDSDAFPFINIDGIFDVSPQQKCNKTLLPIEDQKYPSDICSYVFAGHVEEATRMINAGVFVLKPDQAMYARLAREASQKDTFNNGFMEQSMLTNAFDPEGAFPVTALEPRWNAFSDYEEKGLGINILHDKMWAHYWEPDLWVTKYWNDGWEEMLAFFKSPEFEAGRNADRAQVLAELDQVEGSKASTVEKIEKAAR